MLLVILAGIFGSPEETAQNGLTEDIQGSVIESNLITANGPDRPPEQQVDAPAPEPPPPAQEDTPEKQKPAPQPTQPTGTLKVHFIDVGQGDAIFIQAPSKNVLIDGGDRGNTAINYLKAQGVNQLDLVIGTHPHADHIGGLINVFQSIPVKEVIDPAVVHTTKTFEDYLTLIDQIDIKFTEGRAGMSRDEPISLGAAPELVGGRTFVPLQFFREVIPMNNAYVFDAQIVINNNEEIMH